MLISMQLRAFAYDRPIACPRGLIGPLGSSFDVHQSFMTTSTLLRRDLERLGRGPQGLRCMVTSAQPRSSNSSGLNAVAVKALESALLGIQKVLCVACLIAFAADMELTPHEFYANNIHPSSLMLPRQRRLRQRKEARKTPTLRPQKAVRAMHQRSWKQLNQASSSRSRLADLQSR